MTRVTTALLVEPHQRRWTREEYYRMGELGLFRGQRVELIDGAVMVLSPQGPSHATSVERVRKALEASLGAGVWVRTQLPVDFGTHSEPEPDISVVSGSLEDYTSAHPVTALLIVEVSDTTLSYDRNNKASLYAHAGITDYWIVNLVNRQLEIRRQPVVNPNTVHGFDSAEITILRGGDTVSPLCRPQTQLSIAELLP
ncbi:Uma2 family endonuclease [Candidatus Entotheonella palauensis]|uniref:Uma2 family endonuclease n=1 Tax=Candidatus Entotheonella palauensis TaxID=93172 RepID=UPI00277B5A54|nr:Uma2 family endonuclease [Candidatus Entotheonella palauensis]